MTSSLRRSIKPCGSAVVPVCDIPLESDALASRAHAELVRTGDDWAVSDDGCRATGRSLVVIVWWVVDACETATSFLSESRLWRFTRRALPRSRRRLGGSVCFDRMYPHQREGRYARHRIAITPGPPSRSSTTNGTSSGEEPRRGEESVLERVAGQVDGLDLVVGDRDLA